jgi:hypothetical protein
LVTRSRHDVTVSGSPARYSCRPRLSNAYTLDSSSRTLRNPYRVSRTTTRPALMSGHLPGASFPHRGTSCGVHSYGHPKPATVRPRRFSRPRRFAPPQPARVYFTPQPRPGFALQGLSPARSRTSSSLAVALVSFARGPCPQLPNCSRTTRSPSGPCSSRRSVASRKLFRLARCSIPS